MFTKKSIKVSNSNEIVEEDNKVELYVPFEYKEQAKDLNAKWDQRKKGWYTMTSNKNSQKLIDIFHMDNFYCNFRGTHMKTNITTEKERLEIEIADDEQYKKLYNDNKEHVIKTTGKWTQEDESDFGKMYSVNYMGHE
jgi:hypothetical protein